MPSHSPLPGRRITCPSPDAGTATARVRTAMRVTRVLLYVLVVAVVAVVVLGTVSVLSARPELNDAKQHVNNTWSPLATELGPRYAQLEQADDKLLALTGPVRTLADRVHSAVNDWNNAKA